ncbi:MAG: tRNA (guanosine(46)-N7)-methyltransferase TrmB [Legionellaceae bacterium]|nr:tRNA (guanosine(46)-N7)-methyltransferase TrmB [Legionellaceae bacterium]
MRRTIKSYVLRAGRMTERQRSGWDEHYPRLRLPTDSGTWDFSAIFGRTAPTILEIGFGMGHSLLAMAQAYPENNYIGLEVHQAGVGALAADIAQQALPNVRLLAQDAVEVLQQYVADGSLAGVQIFFPDPWPKKKHHKRRLIQPPFTALLVQKLQKDGFIHCATDWEAYAQHMLAVLSAQAELCNRAEDGTFFPRPPQRPLTKFEQRGQRLGHGVWDVYFVLR